MMRRNILLLTLFLACISGMAENKIVINDVTVPQGGMQELAVTYQLDKANAYVGYAFKLQMPEGVSTVKDEDGLPEFELDSENNRFNLTVTAADGFGALPKSASVTISGTSGTLLTLTLQADASLAVGSTHTVTVSSVMLSEKTADGQMASVPLDDFTFTVTIGEPDDGRIKFYETATKLPAYTAGEKANVTMYRTIKANEWSTIVLPFTLPKAKAEAVFGSDVEIYEYKDYTATIEDPDVDVTPTAIQINFTRLILKNSLSSIAGGTPYLIKTSRDIDCIEVDDVKLAAAVKNVSGGDTEYRDLLDGLFKGTFVKTTIPADGLFICDNSFWYSTGKTNIKAFRAWLELDAVLNKEIELSRISFSFDDTTNGISTNKGNTPENGNYYDLSGRKVSKPSKKGLYIKNGKKVVK